MPRLGAAQPSTRVAVTVVDSAGQKPISATVVLTIAPTTESLVETTDAGGLATVRLTGAQRTGEYIVSVSAIGFRTARRRIVVPGADSVFSVRFALAAETAQIATVRVQATVPRAARSFGADPSVADGQNRRPDGVRNAVDPSQQGTLEALTASLPGLTRAEGGVSAFGLGASGTTVAVNGMQQGVSAVPRDLAVTTTVLTSPWDATRGAFSGALVSHSIQSGGNIARRTARTALSGRWTEAGQAQLAPADRLSQNAVLGGGGSGAWLRDRGFYNVGVQYTESRYQSLILAASSPTELERIGQSTASIQLVRDALSSRGLVSELGVGGREVRQFSLMQRLDFNARPSRTGSPPRATSLVSGVTRGDLSALGASTTTTTSADASLGSTNAFAQLTHSFNAGAKGQTPQQTTLGVSLERVDLHGQRELPSGIMQTSALASDGRPMTSSIQFGGSTFSPERAQNRGVDLVHQASWLIRGKQTLPSKLVAQLRYDDGWVDARRFSLGQFEYASPADFRDARPASFVRTLEGSLNRARMLTGALASSTSWEARRLSLTAGARLDLNREISRAAPVPAHVQAVVGPLSASAVSPRVGFAFYPSASRGPALLSNVVNSSYRTGPHFRGGVGLFRGTPRIDDLVRESGGRGVGISSAGIRCLGSSVPTYAWATEAGVAAPDACLSSAPLLTERWSTQRLLSRRYKPSEALRANLGWTSTIAGNYVALDFTSSSNRHLAGVVDLLYPGRSTFTLDAEGGRPVFVNPEAIDPRTGRITRGANSADGVTSAARLTDATLRGYVRSISVFAIPRLPLSFGQISVAYVASQARRQYRGFDGASGTTATAIEWADDAVTPRHALVLQAARLFRRGDVGVSFSSRLSSGERFSPLVTGDINGDGIAGDRAFIPSATSTADTALANGLARLRQRAPSRVRECLARAAGAIAPRNGCAGPLTVSSNLSLVVSRWPGLSQRAQITINLNNPLGLLSSTGDGASPIVLGGRATADRALLRVDRFDATTRRFSYTVNENFGRTLSAIGARDPVRLTADVRVDLAPWTDLQRLKLNLKAATGKEGTVNADSIKVLYRDNVFTQLYSSLLRLSDSLALSRTQIEEFQRRDQIFRSEIDSIFTALGNRLSAPEGRTDLRAATRVAVAAEEAAWNVVYAQAEPLRRVLSDGQVRRLPSAGRSLVTVKGFRARFFF